MSTLFATNIKYESVNTNSIVLNEERRSSQIELLRPARSLMAWPEEG